MQPKSNPNTRLRFTTIDGVHHFVRQPLAVRGTTITSFQLEGGGFAHLFGSQWYVIIDTREGYRAANLTWLKLQDWARELLNEHVELFGEYFQPGKPVDGSGIVDMTVN